MKCLGAIALEPFHPIVRQCPSKALLCALDDLAEQESLVFAAGLRERGRQPFGGQGTSEHTV